MPPAVTRIPAVALIAFPPPVLPTSSVWAADADVIEDAPVTPIPEVVTSKADVDIAEDVSVTPFHVKEAEAPGAPELLNCICWFDPAGA